jgi:hypothetical protein
VETGTPEKEAIPWKGLLCLHQQERTAGGSAASSPLPREKARAPSSAMAMVIEKNACVVGVRPREALATFPSALVGPLSPAEAARQIGRTLQAVYKRWHVLGRAGCYEASALEKGAGEMAGL